MSGSGREINQDRQNNGFNAGEFTGKPHTIVWAYPDHLENNFSDMEKNGAPEVGAYRAAIASLPGFDREEILRKPQPNTAFAGLTEDTVQRFLEESLKAVKRWTTE